MNVFQVSGKTFCMISSNGLKLEDTIQTYGSAKKAKIVAMLRLAPTFSSSRKSVSVRCRRTVPTRTTSGGCLSAVLDAAVVTSVFKVTA